MFDVCVKKKIFSSVVLNLPEFYKFISKTGCKHSATYTNFLTTFWHLVSTHLVLNFGQTDITHNLLN